MPDRVKQAIFDMLASRYDSPGALPPLFVADVFAGGGSMGLEALSRGAAFCSFYERDRQALEALRGNIESLGAGQESRVVAGDAWRGAMTTPDGRPFTLIFLDPPYRDCEDTSERGEVRRFLHKLGDAPAAGRLLVLHHPAGRRFVLAEDDSWQVVEERRIGSNAVTFFAS
jgi:16S rRNA (guanine(966)-N(2))-methyltransferase RsmD